MWDAIVVGAGPAGSSAARTAAKGGLRVLLIDENTFPRYKFCGGALSNGLLSSFDFRLDDVIERKCRGICIMYGDKKLSMDSISGICSLVSRDEFDNLLVEKAVDEGAEFKEGERVRKVRVGKKFVEVVTKKGRYRARAAVGADGVMSAVAKNVRPPYGTGDLALTLGSEVQAKSEESECIAKIDLGAMKMGYGWVFPKRERFSIGLGAYLPNARNIRQSFLLFLKSHGFKKIGRIYAHLLPIGSKRRKICADRLLLCGDAAGFVDPFYGEGIRYAVFSGRFAGGQLLRSCEKDDFSARFLQQYEKRCYASFGNDLMYASILAYFVYNNINFFFNLLLSNKETLAQYLKVVAGEKSYKDYLLWLIPRAPLIGVRGLLGMG